jgi:hypothetical protein
MMHEQQQVAPPVKPRGSSRGATIALLGLIEIAIVAFIVTALLGQRVSAVADLVEQIPGGRAGAAGGGVVLLLIAALVMTFQVSD